MCVRESRVLKWGERYAASPRALKSDAAHDIDVTREDAPKGSCASLYAIGGAWSASRAVSRDVTRGIGDCLSSELINLQLCIRVEWRRRRCANVL